LSRTAFACEADAQQALATFTQGLQATSLHEVTIRPTLRYTKRGRPGKAAVPAERSYHIEGALTSSLAVRDALAAQHSCFILATNELDECALSPQALLAGYKGQKHAERGLRFLKDPLFLASSLYLKKPQRIMALLMVMTVCLLVYAALEHRIRTTLREHEATFPDQKGQPIQNPTARWVFQYFVGIHLLLIPGEWPLVLNLTDTHEHLLGLLGQPYKAFYS
jgi:transposase